MCKKLKNFIDNIYSKYISTWKTDGILHAYCSTVLTVLLFPLFSLLPVTDIQAIGISMCVTFLIGVVKEIVDDKVRNTEFSLEDLKNDSIGILVGFLISLLFIVV